MSVELTGEARVRLDAHLDAVERVLGDAGHTREQRRAVTDDLEAQIMEMLGARSATPGVGDVEAVLGQLDPPGAYGDAELHTHPPVVGPPVGGMAGARPRYSRVAIWGLVCILVSVLMWLVILPVWWLVASEPGRSPRTEVTSAWPPERAAAVQAVPGDAVRGATGGGVEATAPAAEAESRGVEMGRPAPGVVEMHVHESRPAAWSNKLVGFGLCFGVLMGPLGLLGTILGWVAFAQIRRSHGAIVGMGMALFDGLFYPVLTVLVLAFGMLFLA